MPKLRVALIASDSHRRGPDSRLIRFVREFEEFLRGLSVKATLGAWWSITKCGLLTGHSDFEPLPAGRQGGLVYITHEVVKGHVDVVIYFMDPRDPTSIYPETTALKRVCVTKNTFFLSTYASAVEWASLAWLGTGSYGDYLLEPLKVETLNSQGGNTIAKNLTKQKIALIAHDARKAKMLEFALVNHRSLLEKFHTRVATGTTGGYINGDLDRNILLEELKEELQKAKSPEEREEIAKDVGVIEHIIQENITIDIVRQASGPKGGDVEIAHQVIEGECDKVIFFEDPYLARPHEADIQLLERTCRFQGERVVCLSDPVSADVWATTWKSSSGAYFGQAAITVLRALERRLSTPENRMRVVLASTVKGSAALTMQNICKAAAWYVASFIERLAWDRINSEEPVRFGLPWGATAGDFIRELENAQQILRKVLETHGATLRAPQHPRNLVAMPMIGVIGSDDPSVEANALAAKVATLYADGKALSIPSGAFVRDDKYSSALLGTVYEEFPKADIVMLSGAPPREEEPGQVGLTAKAPIWPDIKASAISQHTVGEVCGLWLSATGEPIATPPYSRVGFDWGQLQTIAQNQERRVILLIGGNPSYLPLAQALLKAKVVSTLVTDLDFGRRLLDFNYPTNLQAV